MGQGNQGQEVTRKGQEKAPMRKNKISSLTAVETVVEPETVEAEIVEEKVNETVVGEPVVDLFEDLRYRQSILLPN